MGNLANLDGRTLDGFVEAWEEVEREAMESEVKPRCWRCGLRHRVVMDTDGAWWCSLCWDLPPDYISGASTEDIEQYIEGRLPLFTAVNW